MPKKSQTTKTVNTKSKAKVKAKPRKVPAKTKRKKNVESVLQVDQSGNLSIRAAAGSGKSTTIEWNEYPSNIPKGIVPSEQQQAIFDSLKRERSANYRVRVCCFNSSIQKELEPRFPEHDVRTNHSLGFGTVKKYLNIRGGGRFVQEHKYRNIAHEIIGNPYDDNRLWPIISNALKLVSMARITLTGSPHRNSGASKRTDGLITGDSAPEQVMWEVSQEDLIEMARFYSIDIEEPDSIKHVERIINIGIRECRNSMDYDDMVFLPNVFGCKPDKVDRVYIDEMQDLNASQHGLQLGSADQFIVVGDVYQSIYGFAGADPESMPRFEKAVGASLLPLTITRRCPHKHVEYARQFLPEDFGKLFQAAPDAPDGVLENKSFDIDFYESLVGTSNLCLSRTNAPMVSACFTCWKNSIPAVIRGRNIAKTLVNVIKRCKAGNNKDMILLLTQEYEEKIGKLKAQDKTDFASAKQDELDIIVMFLTETKTPDDCVKKLYDMFNDTAQKGGVQFSTVHKAKGLEATNLAILNPGLLPHPGISKIGPFWARQELNIAYVCATRGMENLFLNTA